MISLDKYKGKKVLITGHSGFKGAWLAIWLEMLGARVVGLALDPIHKDGIFQLSGIGKQIKDVRGDIRNLHLLCKVFKEEQPDFVFHLAAQALVLESYRYPV
jgi:CDP-glucose 4,6-dehydratase